MYSIEVVLAMLLLVLASGYVARMLPAWLPLPLVQIGFGAVVAGVFQEGVQLDPHVFFLLFLPPLLFLDGWRIPKTGLFRDKTPILALALGLVVFTVVGMGFLLHWLIPAMPLPVAFALAAVVSPTDPVALSSITARAPLPPRLRHILEGESLLNDASGLVCFRFAVTAALTGGFSLLSAGATFAWLALGGIGAGVLLTLAATHLHTRLSRSAGEEAGLPILLSVLIPFGAYLLAEDIGASGILAAVAAGITMSYVELSGRALATTRVQRTAVWDMLQFALNGIIFVLLGEQLPGIVTRAAAGHSALALAGYALAINLGLAALRLAWVWATMRLLLFRAHRNGRESIAPSFKVVAVTTLAGVRGAITLAGVLTLPLVMSDGSPFPGRDLAIFLATSVILVSLVVASAVLPSLGGRIHLPAEPEVQRAEDAARLAAARAGVAAVERAQATLPEARRDPDLYAQAAVRVMALYDERMKRDGSTGIDADVLRRADAAERALRLAGLQAEREVLFDMARHMRISDEVARRLVREIDLVESRYR
ncbi:Na+/H+ antiporter [Luteimonas huabeiensis]|uniref:Na+/H+ antiporter n=1 Tax=Luteimonas huabeiensis TaxID=1244513 RepID=UPI000466139E|nr:Na+/H+ antiporter [Luteimonas huabeiensis]